MKVDNLYNLSTEEITPLVDFDIMDGKLYANGQIVDNLYQNLTSLMKAGKQIKELKPSEYINSKISENKKIYQDKVAKRTNEILEMSKQKDESKETVKRTISFPTKYGLKSNIPYDDIPYEDITKFLLHNNVELKQSKIENLESVQKLISSLNYDVNAVPRSIDEWIANDGKITYEVIEEDLVEVEEEKTKPMKIPVGIDRPDILKFSEFIVAEVDIVAPAKDLKIRVPMFRSLL
jgi:phenylalanyl-tRNA synthetase alpha subunit